MGAACGGAGGDDKGAPGGRGREGRRREGRRREGRRCEGRRRREEREELWGWSLALLPPTEATVAVRGGEGRKGWRSGHRDPKFSTQTTPEERGGF